jgi:Hemerythrin HHE cation binding domain
MHCNGACDEDGALAGEPPALTGGAARLRSAGPRRRDEPGAASMQVQGKGRPVREISKARTVVVQLWTQVGALNICECPTGPGVLFWGARDGAGGSFGRERPEDSSPGAIWLAMKEEAMPDVFEVLGTAHRETEQMLDRMHAMMGAPAELREHGGSLADTLISAVSQHEAAEEAYFWPAVREKVSDGDALAAGGIEQETEGKKVLADLDGMAPGDQQVIPLMTNFATAARAHIAYEEQQVWPSLRAALAADEARRLGAEIASATQAGLPGRTRTCRPAPRCSKTWPGRHGRRQAPRRGVRARQLVPRRAGHR